MMTLHDTIELTKKVAIFGVIGIIGIFILVMLFRFGGAMKERFFPTPPPAVLTAFGKLPTISFPESDRETELTYTLDTVTGTYPYLGDRVNVYKFVKPLPEFYDLTRGKTKAKTLKLDTSPVPVSENIYRWTESTDLGRSLMMDVMTTNFSLTSNYLTYQPVLSGARVPDPDSAIETAKEFFESLNSFPDTINEASTSARTMAIRGGGLVDTTSLQDAQIIRVDFYRSEVDSLPIYYPDFPNSLISALVAGDSFSAIVVEAQFTDHLLSDEFSDYPIKTSEQAFKELQEGKGHVASYNGQEQEIKIKEIKLGYYLGPLDPEQDGYLMPIVVFTGDDGFIAYVSAVSDEFIE